MDYKDSSNHLDLKILFGIFIPVAVSRLACSFMQSSPSRSQNLPNPKWPRQQSSQEVSPSQPKPPSHKLYLISHIPNWWLVGVLVWWPILFWAYPAYLPYPFKWWKIPIAPKTKNHQIDSAMFSRSTIHTPKPSFFSSSRGSIQVWLTCMGVLDLLGSSCLQYLRALFKKIQTHLTQLRKVWRCLVGVRFWRLEDFWRASNGFLVLGILWRKWYY